MAIYKLDDLLKKHNVTEDQVTTYGSPQSIQNSLKQLQKPKEEQSFLGSLKEDLNTRVDRTGAILNRPDSSSLEKGTQLFGQGAGLAANAIEKTVEQVPGVKQAFGAVGAGIKWLSESAPIKAIANQIGESKTLQEVTNLYDTDQNFKDSVDAIANIVRLGGDVQMAQDAVNFTKNVTNKIADKVKTSLPPGGGGGAISNVSENALKAGTELKNNVQLSIAKKNVNPQLESSANRLFLDGTKNLENPIATYDNYLAQSKKALGDIKADPAISTVGEKMGNAFETVVKQRQAVGKVLGEELKANGSVKVSVVEPKTNLLNDLKDSGLSYNPKTNKLTSFQGSKFAPEEVKMLNDFVKGVNSLGETPSVSQIDNFIAKTRSTLEFTKGKAGVIGTTNAERIIKGGVAKLRATLDPAVNGNQALSKYWTANKTYSELSDFVEEGSQYLGKKTTSGDFAKDASVAKSSVQSILNNGKKDFMLKLEALTGYKAIDDAVLALQAMKDAGDFRGLSLLQAMSETGIPTSKAGFTQKIIDAAIKKGGEFLAGTPEEQTRAFLQDLLKNEKIANPSTTTPTTTPKTGASTNKINQSNKSVIPKSSPKSTPKSSLKGQGKIPTTNLISEAKKYKSAEEFVNAKTNAYHGTDKVFDKFDLSKVGTTQKLDKYGMFFTSDKQTARNYSSLYPQKSKINWTPQDKINAEKAIVMDAFIKDSDALTFSEVMDLYEKGKIKTKVKSEGFVRPSTYFDMNRDAIKEAMDITGKDVFKITKEGETFYMVNNPDKMITKSQLEEIWKKANKNVEIEPLIQQAKKYKSAEEFVKAQTKLTYKNLQENEYSIKELGKDFDEPVEYYRAGSLKKDGDIWLTDNPAGAAQYSSAGGGTKVGSYVVQSKNPLIIDTAGGKYANGNIDINKILTKEEIAQGYTNNPTIKQKFIDYAKKNDYDAVQFADSFPDGEGGMRSLVVWNKDMIKTKSQLTDIWKKANQK